ncbi:hypothetical protein CHS0354_020790 [Potamilus streckersoni]|uniref:Uncharacterized protein n=1 Tax=Potamilus streckersoni TaxID=2493646 RepID=A0AAE0SCQ7_9BIVA|nr:hypothetical protein CHS0354_020790 [Potamilus streckersoni]
MCNLCNQGWLIHINSQAFYYRCVSSNMPTSTEMSIQPGLLKRMRLYNQAYLYGNDYTTRPTWTACLLAKTTL